MIDKMNKEQDAGIKTIALCSEDSEFGVNIDTIEADLAAEYGLELVEHISYSASATNVTSEVLKLKAADADVVMFSSYTADAILFMQTFKEQNYYPKMLVGQRGGFSRTEMFQTVPEAMQYVYNTCAWASDLDQPNVQLMCDLYQEATGNPAQEGPMRAMTDFYTARTSKPAPSCCRRSMASTRPSIRSTLQAPITSTPSLAGASDNSGGTL